MAPSAAPNGAGSPAPRSAHANSAASAWTQGPSPGVGQAHSDTSWPSPSKVRCRSTVSSVSASSTVAQSRSPSIPTSVTRLSLKCSSPARTRSAAASAWIRSWSRRKGSKSDGCPEGWRAAGPWSGCMELARDLGGWASPSYQSAIEGRPVALLIPAVAHTLESGRTPRERRRHSGAVLLPLVGRGRSRGRRSATTYSSRRQVVDDEEPGTTPVPLSRTARNRSAADAR